MSVQTANRLSAQQRDALVNEGKTKQIVLVPGKPDLVRLVAKDDITAGDGAKHDVIPDKGRFANATTSNVFRLLRACGLPVAFTEQDSPTSFIAPRCQMLPYEVVVRREAHGSYLKRNPQFAKGQLFPRLIVEFFLKTKDRNWKGKPLTCDDPLLSYTEGTAQINVEFNDESYRPLSTDGGHGIIGFTVTPAGGAATLPSVPGYTADLPEGAMVVAKARTRAPYDSEGYLPPCSGGMGNTYSATLRALSADGTEVGYGYIVLGKY